MSLRAASGRDRYLLDSPRARAEARRVTARSQRARALSSRHTNPPLYPLSTLLLLALGAWTFFGAFILGYPYTVAGQDSVLRVLGAAIVLTLGALWLRYVGFSRLVTALAGLALAGVALAGVALAGVALAGHTSRSTSCAVGAQRAKVGVVPRQVTPSGLLAASR